MVDDTELDRIFMEERRNTLEETRVWIDALSEEERETPFMNVSGRDFSPLEVMREIEEITEFGRVFVRQSTAQRLEAAKRSEEVDAEIRKLED